MSKRTALSVFLVLCLAASPLAHAQGAAPPLVPKKRVDPEWPRAALTSGISGTVRVAGTVAKDGSVKEVHVIESHPAGMFDASAIRAVKQWTFEPHVVDGVATEREFEHLLKRIEMIQREPVYPPPPPYRPYPWPMI